MQLVLARAPTVVRAADCKQPIANFPTSVSRVAVRRGIAQRTAHPISSVAARAAAQQQENGAAVDGSAEVIVKIDNESDAFATVVTVEFGDKLGELLDTVAALKNLGLNIKRAKLTQAADGASKHKFFVTNAQNSEKIVKSKKIEEIRLTILNTMLEYHPEAGEQIAWSAAAKAASEMDATNPLGAKKYGIRTQIEVREHESGSHSELFVNTLDRPGLLTDIVKTLKDINLNVISAEVDTIGKNAFDKFNVTYHGEALTKPMCELAVNALQYYLSMSEVEKEWSESY